MAYQPVAVKQVGLSDNRYRDGKRYWAVTNLIELARDLPVFELPLCAVHVGTHVWTPIESAKQLAEHVRRVMDVDTTRPVILDDEGFIMDGWHRVVRAMIDGRSTIPAVRFEETPPPNWEDA